MMHRFLLCILVVGLVASVQAAEHATNETVDSWSGWSVDSDEGGGGSSYLGVDIADVTAERLSALKLKEEHGAEVTMVDQDAPAGKAGLREHDVILSVNGSAVESAAQLRRMIKETPPGRVVTLGISRDGQPLTLKVQLADRRKSMSWAPGNHEFNFQMPQIQIPDFDMPVSVVIGHSSMRSGLMVENITPQLGDFFGVKGGNGVLVRSVEKGSRGEKAGFHAGDVIVKVNDQPVHDTSDFTHALRGRSGGSAAVTVVRDKREQNLTLTLPEKKDSGHLLEDTFEIPELSVETQLAIQHAEGEVARLSPEIMEKVQREMARANKEVQRAQEHWQEQQKCWQKHLEDQQQKMHDRQQKMHDHEQKLRHEISGEWTEI
jgi:serine protease Do